MSDLQEATDADAKTLTTSEEKLLEFLSTPESVGMTVTAISDRVNITTNTYYRAFKKEHFVRQLQDEAVGLVHSAVLPVLLKAKENALSDKPNNFHWAKMLLEMSGLYVANKSAQVKADIRVVINMPRPGGSEGKVIDIGSTDAEIS
jgi:hypothetical protein